MTKMIKAFMSISLLILIFSNLGISQIENLDKKNGLFEFKFGSSLENHTSNLELDVKGEKGVVYYRYIGTAHPTVLNEEHEKIIIGFYKEKLYFVNVTFRLGEKVFEDYLVQKIEELFGKGERLNVGEKATWAYGWETKKNYAQLAKDEYANLDKSNYGKIVFMYYSKEMMNKINVSDF